ncbi:Protein involved in initiation of plasmid replication [Cetobacterium ceti]|uniref:Protein involved in initiation of plasmid replication n=1 Tax=Cetobacterium ceti TaxID=180163 RepID=A0A1T4R4W5_9FUSO|nr:replication initiation protein [Cetobacterium ceti]SKA10876.1 Protein involved in initiation of plasmid replication [Cetobacterium ceti]
MKKQELIYHNHVNDLLLGDLSPKVNDIFFSFLFKFKELETDYIEMSFAELKELAKTQRHNRELIQNLEKLSVKLKQLTTVIRTEKKIEIFSPFRKLIIDIEKSIIKVEIDIDFKKMLFELENNYTITDLKELISLKKSYSKNLYRLLKQWESIKKREFTLEEFKKLLAVPKSYKMCDIDKEILIPSIEELKQYFSNLNVKKIKTGVKVTNLLFSWQDKEKVKVEKAIQGAKKILNSAIEEKKQKVQEVKCIEQENEMIEITKNDFDKLYEQYLIENNATHTSITRKCFEIANRRIYKIID